jgi:hypothetical protein
MIRQPGSGGSIEGSASGCGPPRAGAVVYALFRDLFLAERRRAQLELRFDATRNEQVVVGTARNTDAAHVRLRLSNGAGKDTDDVVVMVTEVRRLEDSERTAMAGATPIELPLTWSGTNPPRDFEQRRGTRIRVRDREVSGKGRAGEPSDRCALAAIGARRSPRGSPPLTCDSSFSRNLRVKRQVHPIG